MGRWHKKLLCNIYVQHKGMSMTKINFWKDTTDSHLEESTGIEEFAGK